jgi:hypothetical protein
MRTAARGLLTLTLAAGAALSVVPPVQAAIPSSYVSIDPAGAALPTVGASVVSTTGRYVAFSGNGVSSYHAYWRDTTSNVTKRIDYATDGSDPGSTHLAVPQAITSDGRYVLLLSSDAAMQPGKSGTQGRLFLRDTTDDTTERIALGTGGEDENAGITAANLTADGRYLTFQSAATNLYPEPSQPGDNLHLRDRTNGTTKLVTITNNAQAPNGALYAPFQASSDGAYVAYSTAASNLANADGNGKIDAYISRPGVEYSSKFVSVNVAGAVGNGDSFFTDQSADGKWIVFESDATTLVSGDTNTSRDVFMFNRDTWNVTRVSTDGAGKQGGAAGSISADGRYVAFQSSTAFDATDTNATLDGYLRDNSTAALARVSRSSTGGNPNGDSTAPTITDDASRVLYRSTATNIDSNFGNAGLQLAVLDHTPGEPVTGLTAKAGDSLVKLSWINPDTEFKQVVVRRATGTTPPATALSGTAVYTGSGTTVTATGLTNGTAYSFAVFAQDTDGNTSTAATVSNVKPRPGLTTVLGLVTNTTAVTYGSGVSLTATLVDSASHPVAGEPISFYSRKKGTATWIQLGTSTTNSLGKTARAATPPVNTEFLAKHAGNPFWAASMSAVRTVYVRPKITLSTSAGTALLGSSSRLSGVVTPAHSGQAIVLQQYVSGAWKTVTSTKLTSTGGYAFTVKPASSGAFSYRVLKPADSDHLAVTTPVVKIVRYKAAITTIHYDAAGNDFNNLNDEYVVIRNTGTVTINLANWRLHAGDGGQTWYLPSYGLGAGASVRVHTGYGSNGGGHIYINRGSPVWNNTGDTGYLYDARGALASRYSYVA